MIERRLAAEQLEDRIAPAGNILQVDPLWGSPPRIHEYTLSGTLVRTIDAPTPAENGAQYLRDLVVDQYGNIQLFHGTFHPYLSTYHPTTGTWTNRTTDMWSTVNNLTYGGIATFQNYVYVTDMATANEIGSDNGLIRFNLEDGTVQRFGAGTDYIDLTIGLDGRLYALQGQNGMGNTVDKYDPITMQLVGSANVPVPDALAVSAAANGDMYVGGNDGYLYRLDPAGNILDSVQAPGTTDVDISLSGVVMTVGATMNLDLTNVQYNATLNTGYHVAFADPYYQPKPPVIHDADLVVAPSPADEGQSVTLNGVFTDADHGTHTVQVNWGDGSTVDQWSLCAATTKFSAKHPYPNNQPGDAPYAIHVTVTDADNLSGSANASLVVHNLPPAPAITGAPATSPEGAKVSLGVETHDPGVNDTFTYAWSVTKNGTAFSNSADANFSFTPDDNGEYVVSVAVTDSDGAAGTDSKTIEVKNERPSAAMSGPDSGVHGELQAFSFTASDASTADSAAGFQYLVSWGDGTSDSIDATPGNGAGINLDHTFVMPGDYSVTVYAADQDGATSDAASASITITNALPTTSVSGQSSATHGDTSTFHFSATDADALDQSAGFTYHINWGDGTTIDIPRAAGNGVDFTLDHVFVMPGQYAVNVTAADQVGGTSKAASASIAVANSTPTTFISGASTALRGETVGFTISASDADAIDQSAGFIYHVVWGDGVKQDLPRVPGNGSGVALEHTFAASGQYGISVTVEDSIGAISKAAGISFASTMTRFSSGVLEVSGTPGRDIIAINRQGTKYLLVQVNGTVQGNLTGVNRIVINGWAGNDLIQVASGITVPTEIYGGAGDDVLRSGSGPNILDGGDGNDRLFGGVGRDVLVGGSGADVLSGGFGDDIEIGDLFMQGQSQSARRAALSQSLADWNAATSYAARTAAMATDLAGKVAADNSRDVLLGGLGHDWFFGKWIGLQRDILADQLPNELATAVN